MNDKKSIERITIEGKDCVPIDSVIEPEGDIKIVVLQRGFVNVGYFERNGNDCKLSNASIIRRWGTTKGLGELALGGPTKDTILDKCYGEVGFDYLTVVQTISCKESVWRNAL